MKKTLFLFFLMLNFIGSVAASDTSLYVILRDMTNREYRGSLVDINSESITIKSSTQYINQTFAISNLKYLRINDKTYISTRKSNENADLSIEINELRNSLSLDTTITVNNMHSDSIIIASNNISSKFVDPNYVVGYRMRKVGLVCSSVGGVFAGVGLGCTIIGAVNMRDVETAKGYMISIGSALLVSGVSITVVGIPLVVEGKKIMDMKIQYTGNGAGVVFNF